MLKNIQLFSRRFAFIGIGVVLLIIAGSFILPDFFSIKYTSSKRLVASVAGSDNSTKGDSTVSGMATSAPPVITHLATPPSVRALYMTSWVAGTQTIRKHVMDLLSTTEANAVVIDIKDYTGKISFETSDASLNSTGCIEKRIPDVIALINELHAKGIYVIGRVAVFQDPCFVKLHPEAAVKRSSDGGIWKDRKGISWMDAGSKEVWDYVSKIATTSYAMGFDEINFDYIRFPSDGNMHDIAFPASGARTKAAVIGDFFKYLDKHLRDGRASSSTDPAFDALYTAYTATSSNSEASKAKGTEAGRVMGNGRLVTSADLFGLVTVANDDLGIGQTLAHTLPYVDYIDPMVYPSHFAKGWNNFKNPADHPYDVIKISMASAVARAKAQGQNPQKLRPWLQDFNLGATYTAGMVRQQIQATYDDGLTSWLMWDPNNRYTPGSLLSK